MGKQFAVLHWSSGRTNRVLFEGDGEEVYAWLMTHGVLDAPGYYVLDRQTGMEKEEGVFMREFREMSETEPTVEDKREAVLKIIREINRCDRVGQTDSDGEYLDSEEITNQIVSIFTGG